MELSCSSTSLSSRPSFPFPIPSALRTSLSAFCACLLLLKVCPFDFSLRTVHALGSSTSLPSMLLVASVRPASEDAEAQ